MSQTDKIPTTRFGIPLYAENPTIPQPGQIAKRRRAQIGDDRRGMLIDQDSGEILGHGGAIAYEFEEVDKERFVKLYLAGLKQAVGLSKAGLEVFQLVYDQMRENKDRDYVLLSVHKTDMNVRGFNRGLRELIERKFLFRSMIRDQYWVNIQYMFNGNRLAFVKAYQIKGTDRQLSLLDAIEPGDEEVAG